MDTRERAIQRHSGRYHGLDKRRTVLVFCDVTGTARVRHAIVAISRQYTYRRMDAASGQSYFYRHPYQPRGRCDFPRPWEAVPAEPGLQSPLRTQYYVQRDYRFESQRVPGKTMYGHQPAMGAGLSGDAHLQPRWSS